MINTSPNLLFVLFKIKIPADSLMSHATISFLNKYQRFIPDFLKINNS